MQKSFFEYIVEKCWLPGRENLARHVPSLNRFSGKLGWLLVLYFGCWVSIPIVYLIDRMGQHAYLYTQAVMVFGAFLMVDVVGIWGRGLLNRIFGDQAYAKAFTLCFLPWLTLGFMAGVIHIITVPGHRLIPLTPALILAAPFLLMGLLIAIKSYLLFGLDRFIYMYVYFPDEGTMADAAIFDYIRHPQYASFFFIVCGFVIAGASVESFIMSLYIAAFGIGRIVPEEIELGHRFGDSYKQYRQKVPALFPRKKKAFGFLKYLLFGNENHI
jgi:protein-S-isoprenylcysteine O-methyltransferase Ste14